MRDFLSYTLWIIKQLEVHYGVVYKVVYKEWDQQNLSIHKQTKIHNKTVRSVWRMYYGELYDGVTVYNEYTTLLLGDV